MRIFLTYLYIEIKKSFKIMQKTILFSIIGIVLLFVGIILIENKLQDKQNLELIDVAVIIPEEEGILKMGAQYLSSMDSIESICNFVYLDEESALDKLQNNEVQAVIVFPDNFYEDVYHGVNTPAVVYFPEESALNVQLFSELISDGISMLQISEAGVYSVLDVTREDRPAMKRSKIGDFVADKYIGSILGRGKVFDTYVSSPYGKIDYTQYYYASFILITLLICSVNMGILYKKQEKVVSDKLRIYGLDSFKISMVKILTITLQLWMIVTVVYLISYIISEKLQLYFVYFEGYTIGGFVFVCLALATFIHAVYTLCQSGYQGTTVLLMTYVIMVIGSGIIVPITYLPDFFAGLSKIMPAYHWNQMCQTIIFDEINGIDITIWLLQIAFWLGIGVVGTWKNTQYGLDSY